MGTDPIAKLELRLAAASAEPVDPIERIDALNALAWELRSLDEVRAHGLASEARELARELGYTLGQARAARTMAMSVGSTESLRKVFELGEEARRLFDQTDDHAGRAASRDFLSSIHEFIGDLGGALDLALDALSIARELGDPVRQGYALSSVGGVLSASGEADTAVERLQEALALFEGVGDEAGVGTICSRLCTVLESAGRLDEALAYAGRCREVALSTDNGFLHHTALRVMAHVAQERGDAAEAERLFREAMDRLPGEPARSVAGTETVVDLARLLMGQQRLEEAEALLTDTLGRVAGTSVLSLFELRVREALADLREQQGDLAAALAQLREARHLREHLMELDRRNKLTQLEVRAAMEAAKKDAEIHRLRFVELHAMQSKLVEAGKMALLGKLAAGTAHELNTPLAVLRSNQELSARAAERFVALLQQQGELGTEAQKLARVLSSARAASDEAVERIASITQSFGRFTQLDQAERRRFDVREGLQSALTLLEPTIERGITIAMELAEVPEVEGWPRELNHAFLTVLQNAAQAIDGEGTVAVTTRADGGHVEISVADTGRGMGETQVAHLFDVAWSDDGRRTKMRLGLSAAYATVQRHGGTIEVDSALGEGTTVTFRLPLP